MKKIYSKPEAKYVSFYSEEEITAKLDVNDFAGSSGASDLSGDMGETDVNFGWT
jgi:hypothetical protein